MSSKITTLVIPRSKLKSKGLKGRKMPFKRIRIRSKISRISSFLGKLVHRKINFFVPIYAIKNADITQAGAYSFSGLGTQITPVLSLSISDGIDTSNEFTDLLRSYALFKINGILLNFKRTLIDSIQTATDNFLSFPPIYLDVVSSISIITKQNVSMSDTAFAIQPMESAPKGKSKFYRFPAMVSNSLLNPTFGSSTWITTDLFASLNNNFLMVMGWSTDFTVTGGASEYVTQIGVVEVGAFCTFSKPLNTKNP